MPVLFPLLWIDFASAASFSWPARGSLVLLSLLLPFSLSPLNRRAFRGIVELRAPKGRLNLACVELCAPQNAGRAAVSNSSRQLQPDFGFCKKSFALPSRFNCLAQRGYLAPSPPGCVSAGLKALRFSLVFVWRCAAIWWSFTFPSMAAVGSRHFVPAQNHLSAIAFLSAGLRL